MCDTDGMTALRLPPEFSQLPLGWLEAHPGASHGWSVGVVGLECHSMADEVLLVPALSLRAHLHHNWKAVGVLEAAADLAAGHRPPPLRALLWDHRSPDHQQGWPARGASGSRDLVAGWERFRSACLERLADDDEANAVRSLGAVAPWAFFIPEVNAAVRQLLALPYGLSADDVAMVAALKHVRPPGRAKRPPEVELSPSFRQFCDTFLVEGAELATEGMTLSAEEVRGLSRHYFPMVYGYRQREKLDRDVRQLQETLTWSLAVPFPDDVFRAISAESAIAHLKAWTHEPALVKRLLVCCRGDVSTFRPYTGAVRGFSPLARHWSVPGTAAGGG